MRFNNGIIYYNTYIALVFIQEVSPVSFLYVFIYGETDEEDSEGKRNMCELMQTNIAMIFFW